MSLLVFGKYEIQSRLAIGGMGEVFYGVQRAEVKGFERPVILKNLLPELAQQDGFVEQFLDEARVAATLNHPNVVSIYEVGKFNGVYFIAMEFIRGRNLSQLIRSSIRQSVPIPPMAVAQIIHDAALGLDHAHRALDSKGQPLNIVHRDISPQNIMVREDGVTKVVDFGIASAANRATRTATGAVKGKLAYMAPEQLRAEHLTGQADLFSLGVVLWELATRTRLFQAGRDIDLLKAVMEQPIVPPSQAAAGVPPEFDEIAMKMLERDTARRYTSCAEVARDLEGFLMRFSDPGGEKPVVGLMRKLGQEPLPVPTGPDFVIPLASPPSPETKSIDPQTVSSSVVISLDETGTTGTRPKRRAGLRVGVGLALLAAVGGGLWYAKAKEPEPAHHLEPPAVPAPVATLKPVEVPPAPAAKQVHLKVASSPPGATVLVDGRKMGESPVTIDVPGAREVKVRLEKSGFASREENVQLPADGDRPLSFKLKPVAVAAAHPPGPPPAERSNELCPISVNSSPESYVSLDGVRISSTPVQFSAAAGHHTVTLETMAGKRAVREVNLVPGVLTKVRVEPHDWK